MPVTAVAGTAAALRRHPRPHHELRRLRHAGRGRRRRGARRPVVPRSSRTTVTRRARRTAPRYRGGVLVIDAVEVSTAAGTSLPWICRARRTRCEGEAGDVLGGYGPARRDVDRGASDLAQGRPPLARRRAAVRRHRVAERRQRVAGRAAVVARARPAHVLVSRAREPRADPGSPRRRVTGWDRATQHGEVVGLGGSDAHAQIGGDLDHGGPAAVHLPSYEQSFRTFSIGLPGVTLSKNAAADARAVVDAIRGGHVFTAIDAFAAGRADVVHRDRRRAGGRAGDRVPAGRPLVLRAEVDAPALTPTLTMYPQRDRRRDGDRDDDRIPGGRAAGRVPGGGHAARAPRWRDAGAVAGVESDLRRAARTRHAAGRRGAGRLAAVYTNGPSPLTWNTARARSGPWAWFRRSAGDATAPALRARWRTRRRALRRLCRAGGRRSPTSPASASRPAPTTRCVCRFSCGPEQSRGVSAGVARSTSTRPPG